MTNQELTLYNIGSNLDSLMNLDPRGYGVCRILYTAAREYTGEPLSVHGAKGLVKNVQKDDLVYIITGFVLRPWKKAEMDGIVSSMFLASFLVDAFACRPVIIVPRENQEAVRALSAFFGLHLFDSIEEMKEYPYSVCSVSFTKDEARAKAQADEILSHGIPAAVISNEAPGRNCKGVYHNAAGQDVTELEAKSDILFEKCQKLNVFNLSIGDLGNEIGMGAIGEHIRRYVPYAGDQECQCDCRGGILAESKADSIITATVSDWGCNALMAATAFLLEKPELFHSAEAQGRAMEIAAGAGMLDMYGRMIPSIDGFGKGINLPIVQLMKEMITYPPTVLDKTQRWFDQTLKKGFFEA